MLILVGTNDGQAFKVDTQDHVLPENFLKQCQIEQNQLESYFDRQKRKNPDLDVDVVVFFRGSESDKMYKSLRNIAKQMPRNVTNKLKKNVKPDAEDRNTEINLSSLPHRVTQFETTSNLFGTFAQQMSSQLVASNPSVMSKQQGLMSSDEFDKRYSHEQKTSLQSKNDSGILADLQLVRQTLLPQIYRDHSSPHLNCRLNGFKARVLLDSGAAISVLNETMVEKCDLEHLVDRRFKLNLQGAGQTESVGIIHSVDLEIDGEHLDVRVAVIKSYHDYMLLGLDMMRRHKCIFDVENKMFIFGEKRKSNPFLHWKYTLNYNIIDGLKLLFGRHPEESKLNNEETRNTAAVSVKNDHKSSPQTIVKKSSSRIVTLNDLK